MKYSKLISVSAGVLAVAALGATQVQAVDTTTAKTAPVATAAQNVSTNVQSITIKAASGDAARVYTSPSDSAASIYSVDNGEKLAVQATQLANGEIWFKIGENQWIKATDANYQIDNSTTGSKSDAVPTTGKSENDHSNWYTIATTGVVTIKTKDGKGLTLYSDPDKGTKTNRVLKDGTSWKVLAERNNGELWLNLGGNQWICSTDNYGNSTVKEVENAHSSKPGTKTPAKTDGNKSETSATTAYTQTPEKGIATVTYKTPIVVWAEPGAKPTKRYLPRNSSWKYFAKATVNGQTWYNLGGNQWIPLAYIRVSGQQITQTEIDQELAKRTSGTVVVAYATPIVVWSQPGKNPTKKYLRNKTAWHFFKKTEVNGTTWYNLGGNQWVPSTYVYVRFRN